MATAALDPQSELQTVCKELDQVLIQFMEKIETYHSIHSKSIGYMKSGYLALTKARLNSGTLGLKAELNLEPLTAVTCDFVPGTNKDVEEDGRYSHTRTAFEKPLLIEPRNGAISQPKATRRRVLHEDLRIDSPTASGSSGDDTDTVQDDEPSAASDNPTPTKSIANPRDPLSAFSFMARNSLKPAQTQFSSALSLLIESADVVQEILQLERKYAALLDRKQQLSGSPANPVT